MFLNLPFASFNSFTANIVKERFRLVIKYFHWFFLGLTFTNTCFIARIIFLVFTVYFSNRFRSVRWKQNLTISRRIKKWDEIVTKHEYLNMVNFLALIHMAFQCEAMCRDQLARPIFWSDQCFFESWVLGSVEDCKAVLLFKTINQYHRYQCSVKGVKKVCLIRLNKYLNRSGLLADCEHGFRQDNNCDC